MKITIYISIICICTSCISNRIGNSPKLINTSVSNRTAKYEIVIQPHQTIESCKSQSKFQKTYSDQQYAIMMSLLSLEPMVKNNENYDKYLYFFSFEIGNYLKLVTPTDTISCTYFNSERNYDISPISHVIAYFPVPKEKLDHKKSYMFILTKNDFINSEDIEFRISSKFLYQTL